MASEWIVCRQTVSAPRFEQDVWINLTNVNRMAVDESGTRLDFAHGPSIPVKESPTQIMALLRELRGDSQPGP